MWPYGVRDSQVKEVHHSPAQLLLYRDSCLLIYFQKSRSCHSTEAVPVVTAESQEQLAQMNRRIS